MIDLESVRLFIFSVELGSLTKAAEAAGTVQPVVSQKLKLLEQRVGRRLIDRSPRHLRLTEDGEVFLPKARELLAKHEEALIFNHESPLHFSLAASDHAIGGRLSTAIRAMRAALPANAVIEVNVGFSRHVKENFASGQATPSFSGATAVALTAKSCVLTSWDGGPLQTGGHARTAPSRWCRWEPGVESGKLRCRSLEEPAWIGAMRSPPEAARRSMKEFLRERVSRRSAILAPVVCPTGVRNSGCLRCRLPISFFFPVQERRHTHRRSERWPQPYRAPAIR